MILLISASWVVRMTGMSTYPKLNSWSWFSSWELHHCRIQVSQYSTEPL
jgi:hypothetical protein